MKNRRSAMKRNLVILIVLMLVLGVWGSGWGATVFDMPLTSNINLVTGAGTPAFTRSTAAWIPGTDGIYVSRAINTADINSDGIFIEPAATNYCTDYNAAPDAGITNVSVTSGSVTRQDRTAALAAAGLGNICTQYAFSYANSSGSSQTITVAGATGGTAKASFRCWGRATAGNVVMQLTGAKGPVTIYPRATFDEYRSENITPAATDTIQFVVPDGATFEWVLNQLEVGSQVTTPIVTAGASATRNGAILTVTNGNTNLPVNDFTIYLEAVPYSQNRLENAVLLDFYKAATDTIRVWAQVNGLKKIGNVSYESSNNTQFVWGVNDTVPLAMRVSSTTGTTVSAFGALSVAQANTDNNAATTGNLTIGRKGDNSQFFVGRIKNIKVYNTAYSDADLATLTAPSATSKINLGVIGLPTYDRNIKRIWSLSWDGTKYDGIQGSNNWGVSWFRWTTFTTNFPEGHPTLAKDKSGNFYYAASDKLYRVDATTKAITTAITWYPAASAYSWYPWAWAEDSAGNICTSAYRTGDTYQYVWCSPSGGNNFSRKDTLVTNYAASSHIHSLHCKPGTDRMYVSWGDGADRGYGYSDDLFDTVTEITDAAPKGPTGITFTTEGVWTASDNPSSTNSLKVTSDDSSTTVNMTTLTPAQSSPFYYARAVGDNEIWANLVDDSGSANINGGLYRFTKLAGALSPWMMQAKAIGHERDVDGAAWYSIAHNGDGVIPASAPYVYVAVMNLTGSVDQEVYAFRRAGTSLAGFTAGGGMMLRNVGR